MDGFDDAVARARIDRRNKASQAEGEQGRAAQIGAKLEPELRQLLVRLSRHLSAKTPAGSYRMYRRGVLDFFFSVKSPVGIPVGVSVGGDSKGKVDSFTLITLDGHVWQSPGRLASAGASRKNQGEFVDLSASALASTVLAAPLYWPLSNGALTAKHGKLEIEYTDRELPTRYEPLEDVLGEVAVQLELNNPAGKAPDFFR